MRACLICLALLLAACGSAPDGPVTAANRSAADSDGPAAGAGPLPLRAGAWAAEVRLVSVESPDIAPEDMDGIRTTLAADYSGHDSCLAAEQVHRPPQQFFSGAAEGCRYERLRLADGEIDGAIRCEPLPAGGTGGPEPASHRIGFRGTYAADSYSLEAQNVLESADRSRRVTFVLATEARRIGDC